MFIFFKKARRLWKKLTPKRYKITDPIIVYQMGKVGSTTIYESLRALELDVPIYHLHLLNNLEVIEASIKTSRSNPKETLAEIKKGKKLREKILGDQAKKWNLISLVREPVMRNISAFFQNLTELIPDYYESYQNGSITTDNLINIFLNEYQHNAPIDWFDSQLKDVFYIDVFSSDFPRDTGYCIYQKNNIKLLVIRLENLNDCIQDAMNDFLGIKNFKLIISNRTTSKPSIKIYREFMDKVVLPQQYLDQMYNTKFTKHFYSPEEIDKFRKYWTKK